MIMSLGMDGLDTCKRIKELIRDIGTIENRCGKCMLCRDACPVGAIKGINTKDHYATRNDALYFDKCMEKLTKDFAKLPDIGSPICGICIKVCPFGRNLKKNKAEDSG